VFSVSSGGAVTATLGATFGGIVNTTSYLQTSGGIYFTSFVNLTTPADGIVTLTNNAGTSFNRINLGPHNNASFPAIRRAASGVAIDFVTADGGGYCTVNMGQATFGGSNGYIGINNSVSIDSALRPIRTNIGSSPLSISTGEVGVGDVTTYASAIFAIGSTTRGFLPPRMTDTEVRAIPSPEEGLVVYNTDITHLCVFAGGTWHKLSQSTM
jgi:hypothetical protein